MNRELLWGNLIGIFIATFIIGFIVTTLCLWGWHYFVTLKRKKLKALQEQQQRAVALEQHMQERGEAAVMYLKLIHEEFQRELEIKRLRDRAKYLYLFDGEDSKAYIEARNFADEKYVQAMSFSSDRFYLACLIEEVATQIQNYKF